MPNGKAREAAGYSHCYSTHYEHGQRSMVPVYSPLTESEAAVISALLDAHGIPFFIHGGAFSKLYPGVQLSDYNRQTFMVPAESYALARELLADFIEPSPRRAQ